jgi:hypothetical protein
MVVFENNNYAMARKGGIKISQLLTHCSVEKESLDNMSNQQRCDLDLLQEQ